MNALRKTLVTISLALAAGAGFAAEPPQADDWLWDGYTADPREHRVTIFAASPQTVVPGSVA